MWEDRLALRRYQSAGMVGVQVGEHHVVDLGGIGAGCGEIGRQIAGVGSQASYHCRYR